MFEALADPTRRAVLRDVAEQGPITATELATRLPGEPPGGRQAPRGAAERWPGRLERAGRERRFSATTAPMADAGRWLDRHRGRLG